MSDTNDEVLATAREKQEKAVIDYLEAIRVEIHDLPKRIFYWFLGFWGVGAILYWIMLTAPR